MTDCVRGVAVCFASVIPEYVKGAEARVSDLEKLLQHLLVPFVDLSPVAGGLVPHGEPKLLGKLLLVVGDAVGKSAGDGIGRADGQVFLVGRYDRKDFSGRQAFLWDAHGPGSVHATSFGVLIIIFSPPF